MAKGFYGRVAVVDTLSEGLDQVSANAFYAAQDAVLAGGEIIKNRAHDLANVSPKEIGHARDGRHMRDCIEVALVDKPGTLVSARIFIDSDNVPYAVHQEFGPNGKPFMRPAIDETREEVRSKMRELLAGELIGGKVQVRFRGIA